MHSSDSNGCGGFRVVVCVDSIVLCLRVCGLVVCVRCRVVFYLVVFACFILRF